VPVVHLPGEVRTLYSLPASVEATGTTVGEVIDDLERQVPGLGHRFRDAGRLRRYVLVFVGEEQAALDTSLDPDAEVRVVAATAGG